MDDTLLRQIREGMQVRSAEGTTLGRISRVCFGDQAAYIEVKPHAAALGRIEGFLYIPCTLVATVSRTRPWLRKGVTLQIDAATARGQVHRPKWIPEPHVANIGF